MSYEPALFPPIRQLKVMAPFIINGRIGEKSAWDCRRKPMKVNKMEIYGGSTYVSTRGGDEAPSARFANKRCIEVARDSTRLPSM